jgi:hypothetical protein
LKRDIYKLVVTNEAVERFQITDIEDDEGLENVGVLAGVGVIPEQAEGGERGHHIPEPAELFCDIVFDDRDFDLKSLVEDALAKLQLHHSRSLPIHKYVNAYREKFGAEPPAELLADCKSSIEDLLSPYLHKQLAINPIKSIEELDQQSPTKEKWFELFPRVQNPRNYLPELAKVLVDYLTNHPDALRDGKSGDKTNLKRVIRIYDWLKYGKTKDAHDS